MVKRRGFSSSTTNSVIASFKLILSHLTIAKLCKNITKYLKTLAAPERRGFH
jgi:hypothetical protein